VIRRLIWIVLPCSIGMLGACSSSSSAHRDAASVAATVPSTTTTPAAPAQRIDGTGTALLFHSGPHGFILVNGEITSPLLGSGRFHEKGTFGAPSGDRSTWTATATFTAAGGDTVTFTSVGGVQSFDKNGDPHSATTETLTGGTGRFVGATGSMKTTGVTTLRQTAPNVVLQIYTFTFHGTITTTA
jgi:hypothetical protein